MNQKGFSLLASLVLVVLIAAISIMVLGKFIQPKGNSVSLSDYNLFTQSSFVPQPSYTSSSPAPIKFWTLKKDGKVVYQVNEHAMPMITKWGDWLIMTKLADKKEILQAVNIKNAEEIKLFEDDSFANLTIKSLIIIQGKLFFTTGGYLQQGGVYVLDSVKSQSRKIGSVMSPGIKKEIDGNYVVYGGFGDSCAGNTYIYYLNPVSETISSVVNTEYSCGTGTTYIGYNSQNGFLVAENTPDSIKDEPFMTGLITQILAYPLVKSNPQVLLSKAQIPEGTKSVTIDKSGKRLALLTRQSLALFNISKRETDQIISLDNKPRTILSFNEDKICLADDNSNYLEINLVTNEKKDSKCGTTLGEEQNNKIFDNLKLPENFILTLE